MLAQTRRHDLASTPGILHNMIARVRAKCYGRSLAPDGTRHATSRCGSRNGQHCGSEELLAFWIQCRDLIRVLHALYSGRIGLGDSPAEPKRGAECGVVSARRFPYEIRIAGYTSSKPVSGLKRIR